MSNSLVFVEASKLEEMKKTIEELRKVNEHQLDLIGKQCDALGSVTCFPLGKEEVIEEMKHWFLVEQIGGYEPEEWENFKFDNNGEEDWFKDFLDEVYDYMTCLENSWKDAMEEAFDRTITYDVETSIASWGGVC